MSSKIRLEKEKSSSMIMSLPGDIIVDILARVSRFNYPTLSLVSKHFRSLVESSHLYARRSLLGCTEACLYVMLLNGDTQEFRWYILHRKANGNNRLILIPSLPHIPFARFPRMPLAGSFVGVGSKIYLFTTLGELRVLDCRSHMLQHLPSLPMLMDYTIAGIIDGKIYVIVGCKTEKQNVIMVSNTETQMWESEMTKLDIEWRYMWSHCIVVIADKMYIRDSRNSFVYIPKENKVEIDDMLNFMDWENACVIDDILYYYYSREKMLRTYDSKQRHWGVVKGLESLSDAHPKPSWSNVVNYGEKLVLLFVQHKRVWCAEIALERRQGGEIWGNVESMCIRVSLF